MAKDKNLSCQIEDLNTTPVPRTCRSAFGSSSNVLGIDQDLPLRTWGMVTIICAAFFLIWIG